ncbi:MAG TPA: fibronectin type III domain-containing protein, partial [Tessaracoccus flavescens]|nr:fibronectin type III domain-containing protein [Tessaracoccus flavescens]
LRTSLGQVIQSRVLLDWRDPDGDPLVLKDAWMDQGSEDFVEFTPDGTLTYYDVGKTTGTKLIHLVVSDGSVDQQGTLQVIVGDELLPPVAHGDYATGTVGEELTVDPLANDVGPITRGRALSLRDVQVIDCADCEVTRNFRDGTFTFRADRIGTYYLLYTVVTGPPANGLVRIDITEPKSNNPPVAALDVVLLPPGGSVMTDPLLNDTDVDRDVLVIQSVSEHPALELVLERRHLLTIKAKFTPDAPVTLTYNLSDGQFITQGTIVVIPTPTTGSVAPQATDDVVRVRAGSTVAADLLRNDSSPIGLDLTLSRVLNSPFGDGIWIDRHRVQIAVPAGTNRQNTFFDYEIVDEEGRTTTARVRVEVIGEDAPNSPPEPRQVIERVIAGSTSPIPIPLDGIDPNGDAVRLVGLGSGPRLGRVVAVGEEYLSYEAYPDSRGTDVFHYAVVDSLGARAVGEIRVGVAQPNPSNLAPVGGHDQVTVRPGRQVQIYALGNDYDIDGDQVAYASANPVEMDDPSITARVVDHRDLVLTAPLDEGTYTGRYAIKDSRGMPGSGRLTLVVDADAPLAPPVARDDTVALEAIADKEWAEIDVRSNDVDPDGATEDLRVEVPPYGAPNDESARVSGDGLVTVPITARMQQIRYVVVDPDGNESSGLITVPGREDSVPVLRDPSVVVEAVAGQPLQINVDEYIVGTAGRSVKLTTADNVSSTHGHAKPSGPTAVDFVADPGHVGPASVVFEVSDVVPEGDSSAKTAFVSLKVNVTRAPNAVREQEEDDLLPANLPPTLLVAHPTLHIGPGEGDAVLDLHDLFRDPEGQAVVIDDLRHTAGGVEIVWRLQGTRLLASAHELAERGEFTVLSGYAVDAADGRTPFEVRLEVISSRLDPPTAVPDTFDDLPAGQPHTFDPTINDLSYLRDKTITITGQPRIIAGDGEISREGNLVTITPAEGFSGVLTATYTILDATLDPDRRVEGTIRLTVVAVPGTPSTPYAGTAGDGTISVKYKSGGDGGSPITRRIATATADGLDPVTAECAPESCTIDGVKNGHAWRVSVIERNAVGDSPPSPASQELRPDAKPLPVAKPTTQFGDGQLQIGWTHERVYESAQGGSPIEGYYLRRFDASGTQVGQPLLVPGGASARGYTWTGLTNGEPFTFDVVARNAQFSSDPSPQSDPDWGTGLPSGSAQLNVAAIHDDIGGGFTVTLNRDQVNPNGGDISQFVVTPVTAAGPSPDRAITVAAPFANPISATITGMGQTPTRFSVTATNRAGTAEVGATSEYAVAWPAPALESVTPEVGDGQVRWTVSTNIDDPSAVAVEYTTGDGWLPLPADGVVAGLTNGQQYRFQFRAQVGDRTSAVYTVEDPVRPRAPEPAPARLDAATLRLRSATEVAALAVPAANDWIASAGWDPAGYQFCESTTTDNCQPRSTSRARILPLGDTSYFRWVYGTGQASEPQAITLGRIAEPTYRAQDGTLSRFSFPYVASGHCTIVARDSDGAAVTTTTVDATGGQLVSAARTLTIPDPASTPEAPLPDIPAPAASVTCSLNDGAYSPSFNY